MRPLKNDLGGQAYSVKLNDLDLLFTELANITLFSPSDVTAFHRIDLPA